MVCGDVQVRCASQALELIDFEQIHCSCKTYKTFQREDASWRTCYDSHEISESVQTRSFQYFITFNVSIEIVILYLFICSVASGNHHIFDLLVNNGSSCQPAADGRTILMQAASRGDLKFINHILDNARRFEVLINEKDVDGWNCLFYTLQGIWKYACFI